MMMRTVLLGCVLCAAACGGSDRQPANDPGSVATATPSNATVATTPANVNDPTLPSTSATPGGAASPSHPTAYSAAVDPNAPASPAPTTATWGPSGDAAGQRDPSAHDATTNADNTKINERDRHGTLTPMSQGNSADETKITAAIRRGLMSDKSLSFTAKNVKVITVGTKVTLRGPVNSDQEKQAIEAHAKQTAGVTDVDDQLEVKAQK